SRDWSSDVCSSDLDRVTGRADLFAPEAKVIHADIDPAEISKIRTADVPIVGDVRDVISDLTAAVERIKSESGLADQSEWWVRQRENLERYPLGYQDTSDGLLSPQYVISRIGELTGP